MHTFWPSVMLTSGCYKGNPVSVHRGVADIARRGFGNWLDLFETTATEPFISELADRSVGTARRIAERLKLALFFRPDRSSPEDQRSSHTRTNACA